MLPKIEKGQAIMYKMDKASSTLIVEDHLKGMIKKQSNTNYQPWRSYLVPRYPNSPFGDFPNGYMPSSNSASKLHATKRFPNYEETHAGAISLSKSLPYGNGTGGRSSSLFSKKAEFTPTKTISGAFLPRKISKSEFRRYYERGDIPVRVEGGSKIVWRGVQPENLDYHHFLPIFFDGLREKKDPYRVLALNGTLDMIDKGGSKILPVIPQLIIPIKTNLYTRDKEIIAITLKAIQKMVVSDEMIGQALVPYYRQILPIFNLYINDDLNIGDNIDYRQRKCVTLGTLIHQTLELLETHGGEDAYINIKYLIPTYESCVIN